MDIDWLRGDSTVCVSNLCLTGVELLPLHPFDGHAIPRFRGFSCTQHECRRRFGMLVCHRFPVQDA